MLCLFGVQWIMPSGVIDLLDCWKGGFLESRHWNGNIWNVIHLWLVLNVGHLDRKQ